MYNTRMNATKPIHNPNPINRSLYTRIGLVLFVSHRTQQCESTIVSNKSGKLADINSFNREKKPILLLSNHEGLLEWHNTLRCMIPGIVLACIPVF